MTFVEHTNKNYEELKNRKVITTNGTNYVLTNKLGFINTITKVENGKQAIVYKTPTIILLVEVAFWEGNLLLVVCFVAGLLDVRKRRFVKNKDEEAEETLEHCDDVFYENEVEINRLLEEYACKIEL